jgi:HD-like signal output (HDOD) protein
MSITLQHDLLISDLFKGDLELTSTPNVYFQLKKIIDNPVKSLADAAFVIENDPSLSIRLLKIVNSAFYGFPAKIASIERAMGLIGAEELQNLVLGTVVIDRFMKNPTSLMSMSDFWARSIRCGLIAQKIDVFLGKEFSETIFICGILHNIGQLVFFRKIPKLAKEVHLLIESKENPTDMDEVDFEHQVIGFDHYQTGVELTKLWQLPEVITKSIQLHTYPDNVEKYHKLASIIRLADNFSKMDTFSTDLSSNNLKISDEALGDIIDDAYDDFEEVFSFFYPN